MLFIEQHLEQRFSSKTVIGEERLQNYSQQKPNNTMPKASPRGRRLRHFRQLTYPMEAPL
jgi:hypothetical protein